MRRLCGVLLVVMSSCTHAGRATALSEIRFVPQYGPAQPIELVALSSNGLHALTAAGEGGDSAGLWDLETGTLLRTLTTDGRVTLLGFTRDDRRVIVGGAGGKVAFHDVGTGAVVSAIMNKVTALSVLSNAVLVWNTVRIGEIVGALEGTAGRKVAHEDLARVSPLASAHVIPSGSYRFPRTSDRRQSLE